MKYVIKAFSEKEIQHFTKPKWNQKGVYSGEEKKREAAQLKEKAEKEKEEKWLVGPFFRKRKKSGKMMYVIGHEKHRHGVVKSLNET